MDLLGRGAAASCEAFTPSSGGSVLPVDRDASANWRMAGLLSVGGIPSRTKVCATVSPRGGGQDDTANIQSAIEACPLEQVVSLAAGTFTIAEGSFIQLDRGVTLRGAGAGSTILTRAGGATLNSYNPGNNPTPMILAGPTRYNKQSDCGRVDRGRCPGGELNTRGQHGGVLGRADRPAR